MDINSILCDYIILNDMAREKYGWLISLYTDVAWINVIMIIIPSIHKMSRQSDLPSNFDVIERYIV